MTNKSSIMTQGQKNVDAPRLVACVEDARKAGEGLLEDSSSYSKWTSTDFLANCRTFSSCTPSFEDASQVWAFLEDSAKSGRHWRKRLAASSETSKKPEEQALGSTSTTKTGDTVQKRGASKVSSNAEYTPSSSSASRAKNLKAKSKKAGARGTSVTEEEAAFSLLRSDPELDAVLEREAKRRKKDHDSSAKTALAKKERLLPLDGESDEDSDEEGKEKLADELADEKLLGISKGGNKTKTSSKDNSNSSKPRFFGEMADDGEDEHAAAARRTKRSVVDDDFFSLAEMHKFAEEGEKAWERMQKSGDDDDSAGDDIYNVFFSNDVGEGDDIMFDDFFGPADKAAALENVDGGSSTSASTRRRTSESKNKEAERQTSGNDAATTLAEKKKEALLAEIRKNEADFLADEDDEEEEEDEVDLSAEEDDDDEKQGSRSTADVDEEDDSEEEDELIRMRRERKAMDQDQNKTSENEKKKEKKSSTKNSTTSDHDSQDHEADDDDVAGMDSEDEGSSSCSWEKDDEDAGRALPFSGFDSDGEDCNLSDLDDPEERQLELALRHVGRTPAYYAGGKVEDAPGSDEETAEEDEDDQAFGMKDMEDDDEESSEYGADYRNKSKNDGSEEEEEEEDDEDVEDINAAADAGDDLQPSASSNKTSKTERKKTAKESLLAKDRRIREMEEEVDRLEQEALSQKHWSLGGEVSGKQRDRNSLLELHLDLPMTHFQSKRTLDAAIASGQQVDDEESDEEGNKPQAFDIEQITRQRIADNLFDDVVRKADTRPSVAKKKGENDEEVLNFAKSRVGLGDIYAQQYEEEVFGQGSKQDEKISREKQICKELFGKLMYKLDQLCNAHFTPKPMTIAGASSNSVASIQMEEAVPIAMSASTQAAPSEIKAADKLKVHSELDREELTAVRRKQKESRRKRMEGELREGTKTVGDLAKRQTALAKQNKVAKEKKQLKGVPKERKKKLKNTELLQMAADKAGTQVSRKAEMKKWRKEQAGAAQGKEKGKF
ncbi:unnamed protein product [Amoebophrya sp. A25]|nr:unnamed protein product [Amoebophrya sp. A25]|eukprot:GSA25T00018976001.1